MDNYHKAGLVTSIVPWVGVLFLLLTDRQYPPNHELGASIFWIAIASAIIGCFLSSKKGVDGRRLVAGRVLSLVLLLWVFLSFTLVGLL